MWVRWQRVFNVVVLTAIGLPGSMVWSQQPAQSPEGTVMVKVADVLSSNVQNLVGMLGANGLEFRTTEAAPANAEGFVIRWRVSVPTAGLYRLQVDTERGQRGRSDFSYAFDDGPPAEVVHQRLVGADRAIREAVAPVRLAAGEHVLELRFGAGQRVRVMNRVTAAYETHWVRIAGIRLVPEGAPATPRATAPLPGLRLRPGDRVVFLGDSITEEELFPGHVVRILRQAYPDRPVTCFNSGISLNRTWDALARLSRDVLPLKPTWVIVCLGVNDAMQMAPDEFERTYDRILTQLRAAGIQVVCVTPTGFHAERFADSGQYAHTRDRMLATDRTAAYEAEAVVRLAARHEALCADALGALSRSDLPRDRLMANQWHPNSEGGRLMALSVLRALGATRDDIARTKVPLDLEYYKILEHVSAPDYPRYEPAPPARYTAAGPLVAVTSYTANTVSVLAAADGRLVGRVPVGHHPTGVAFSGKRRELYVLSEGPGTMTVLDAATGERRGEIKLDDDFYPTGVLLDRKEDTAWIACYYGSRVVAVDLQARKVTRDFELGACIQAVWLAEEHNLLLAGGLNELLAVDMATGKVARRLPLEYIGIFMRLSDGEIGAVDTVYWQMHVLDVPSLEEKAVKPAPYASRAMACDGKRWWAGDWRQHRVVAWPAGQPAAPQALAAIEFPMGLVRFDLAGPAR
jgi:lysophospholipase L1-like esterase